MERPCLTRPVTTNQEYGFYLCCNGSSCNGGRPVRRKKCCPAPKTGTGCCTVPRRRPCEPLPPCGCRDGSRTKPINLGFSADGECVERRINRIAVCQQCPQNNASSSSGGCGCGSCGCGCCPRDVQLWHAMSGAVVHVKI